MTHARYRIAPLGFALLSACFATRNDVRILQEDVRTSRAIAARADSNRAAQVAELNAVVRQIIDSLHAAGTRLAPWQVNVQEDLRAMQDQLVRVLELTGESQRRIQDLRTDIEVRNQAVQPPNIIPTIPGDSTRPQPSPTSPGPNQLFQLARTQLDGGSTGTARAGFEELLRTYPNSDLAPDAQYWIAESYVREQLPVAADSAFQLVVQRYPRSEKAATSLYKHAEFLRRSGKTEDARKAYQQVMTQYKGTDVAAMAESALKTMR
jgi:tol-pal system protein YbgF